MKPPHEHTHDRHDLCGFTGPLQRASTKMRIQMPNLYSDRIYALKSSICICGVRTYLLSIITSIPSANRRKVNAKA